MNSNDIGPVILRKNERFKTRAFIGSAQFSPSKDGKNLLINLYGNIRGYFPDYVGLQRIQRRLYIFPNVHGYSMNINVYTKGDQAGMQHATLNIPYSADKGLHIFDNAVFDKRNNTYGVIHYDGPKYRYYIDLDDADGKLGVQTEYAEAPHLTVDELNELIRRIAEGATVR